MSLAESQIFVTQDGSHSIHSERFGVSYHSKYGAVQESQTVFLEAGLYPQLQAKEHVDVLEIGFGSGLNAFMTFLEAERRGKRINYVAIEAYPIPPSEAAKLNYPNSLQADHYAAHFLSLHRSEWDQDEELSEYFLFRKERIRFEEISYEEGFDLIYFDAFAPSAQPELWEADLLGKMFKALRREGVLVTYCAKGSVKRALKSVGFRIESLPGPPGKREMTRAWKD